MRTSCGRCAADARFRDRLGISLSAANLSHGMRRVVICTVGAAAVVTATWAGHEAPVYPSFYPHEIEIRTLAPDQAAQALRDGRVQAYTGEGLRLSGAPPAEIGTIESLGTLVTVRINPGSPRAKDDASACAVAGTVIRALAASGEFISHPYPVTPFHGDYLHHADLAAAAKARFSGADVPVAGVKIKARGALARNHPDWSAPETDWDAEAAEVGADQLMATATFAVNGWLTPPWVRTGWFHAERLLVDGARDGGQQQRVEADMARLKRGDFTGLVERINLERDLVAALTAGCRKIVAGYTVKREYVNVEFSAGIENIGYDAIAGLHSPIFIRTVKLKDFPWNGWLTLGTGAAPAAAWNPIGGLTDPFGRLLGFAVGDPALLPSPYEAGWMLNRIADLPSSPGR